MVASKEEGKGFTLKFSMILLSSGKFFWNSSRACSGLIN
jgi:hypothetical protein